MKKNGSVFIILLLLIIVYSGVRASETGASVLNYETRIVYNSHSYERNEHVVLRITSPDDVKFCQFRIPYSKYYKLKTISGRLLDENGTLIRKLSPKEISTSSSLGTPAFYSDFKIKKFSVVHNIFPYLIDLEFTYTFGSYLNITEWNPVWDPRLPTHKAVLSFTYPKGFMFGQKHWRIGEPKRTSDDKTETIVWESSWMPLGSMNVWMPPVEELTARVLLVPSRFDYIVPGSMETWKTYGDWQVQISEKLNDLPDEEKQKIDELTESAQDTLEMVRILYHYMQDNCRYLLVNIKFGGLLPYPASYVSKNRFGDCKALTNYMKAMLTYKKIPSFPVDVNAGRTVVGVDPDLPCADFNHVFLMVPLRQDTLWLECTSNTAPLGQLSESVHNRYGLMVASGNSRLIKIPALTSGDVACRMHSRFYPSVQGKTTADASLHLRGPWAQYLRAIKRHLSQSELNDEIPDFFPFKNSVVSDWSVNWPPRDSAFADLNASLLLNSPYSFADRFLNIQHPGLPLPEFEKSKERYYPVSIDCPLSFSDSLFYDIDGLKYELKDSAAVERKGEFGNFSIKRIIINDSTLMVLRNINLPIQMVPLDQYTAFRNFYSDILNCTSRTLLFKP